MPSAVPYSTLSFSRNSKCARALCVSLFILWGCRAGLQSICRLAVCVSLWYLPAVLMCNGTISPSPDMKTGNSSINITAVFSPSLAPWRLLRSCCRTTPQRTSHQAFQRLSLMSLMSVAVPVVSMFIRSSGLGVGGGSRTSVSRTDTMPAVHCVLGRVHCTEQGEAIVLEIRCGRTVLMSLY